nr:unnamed protein product [Digitaria exilis]
MAAGAPTPMSCRHAGERGKRQRPAPRRSVELLLRLAACPASPAKRGRLEKAVHGVVAAAAAAANRGWALQRSPDP